MMDTYKWMRNVNDEGRIIGCVLQKRAKYLPENYFGKIIAKMRLKKTCISMGPPLDYLLKNGYERVN